MTTGTLITVIVTGLLSGGIWQGLAAWRASRVAGHKDHREAQIDHVQIIDAWRQQTKDTVDDLVVTRREAREARAETASLRRDVDSLLDRVGDLEDEVRNAEADKMHLAGYVLVVTSGVAAGTVPPLPPVPPRVEAILARISKVQEAQQEEG